MPLLKEIEENLKATSMVQVITEIYQEVANRKMQKIRQGVLSNREFIEQLSQVYGSVKRTYISSKKREGVKEKSPIKYKNGKVVVFLSSSEHFHGTLILNIWKKFLNYVPKNKADLVIVGRIGKYLASATKFKKKFSYFNLDEENPKKEEAKNIIDFISKYEEIIVFHGKFSSILSQKAVQTTISGEISAKETPKENKSYLFEPSIEDVLNFFETELVSAFLNQILLEHRLSEYAIRMTTTYRSTQNAKEQKRKLNLKREKLERQLLNKKQIELFSGFSLWKKKKIKI